MKDFEKELAPYLLALQLKALGFDFSVTAWSDVYTDHIILMSPDNWCNMNIRKDCVSRPTYSQAFRWFREKYKLHHNIIYLKHKKQYLTETEGTAVYFDETEYDEAELTCLKKLIQIVNK